MKEFHGFGVDEKEARDNGLCIGSLFGSADCSASEVGLADIIQLNIALVGADGCGAVAKDGCSLANQNVFGILFLTDINRQIE